MITFSAERFLAYYAGDGYYTDRLHVTHVVVHVLSGAEVATFPAHTHGAAVACCAALNSDVALRAAVDAEVAALAASLAAVAALEGDDDSQALPAATAYIAARAARQAEQARVLATHSESRAP
jgi:hypothetical protein